MSSAVQIPVAKFTDGAYDWQLDQLGVFDRREARFFMDECHRRSRKTTLAVNLLIKEAAKNDNKAYCYVAPTYTAAKDIVWLDPNMLFSYLPPQSEYPWEKNESDLFVRFPNGSIIHILGADKPDRLRGIDSQGVVFDEWDQMKPEIWPEIFRPIMMTDPARWAMFIYTTKQMHAAAMFDNYGCIEHPSQLPVNGPTKKSKPGWYCVRLDAEHSGLMPPAELRSAKEDMPAHLYDQELRCARVTEEERSLITSRLMASLKRVWTPPTETRKIIACDPSEGRDECVIYGFEDTEVVDTEILREPEIKGNLMVVCGYLRNMAMDMECTDFIIDAVGLGSGVASNMAKDKKFRVQRFKGGRRSAEPERFKNLNMEAVYYVAKQMRRGVVSPIEDPETRRQLVVMSRFQQQANDVWALDTAEKIREALGCSPDRGKAYMMGIYGLQFVEGKVAKVEGEDYGKNSDDYGKRKRPSRPVEAA